MNQATPTEQLSELKAGVVDLISEGELLKKLEFSRANNKPLRIKFGADPTKPDLHLGHTVVLNKLRKFQSFGYRVHFLIGDFTSLIGDPTGRNETRPPLTSEQVKANAKSYTEQVFKVLDPEFTDVVFNSEWLMKLTPIDFVKLTGQYTLARMLERDDFTKRFQNNVPISLHELLYPLCQGYDSVHLKSDVELGGTDQKFNLLVGRELQRSYGLAKTESAQVVMTMPILEGLDGVQKMSKSFDNYIGVTESPKEMFGKIMRLSDELMFKYYLLLTDLSPNEIEKLKSLHPKQVKVNLGKILVTRFHSASAALEAHEAFEQVFSQKQIPTDIAVKEVSAHAEPQFISHLLVQFGLAESGGEAKRLLQGRAIEINEVKVENEKAQLVLKSGEVLIIKAGKKKFLKVKVL